MFKAMLAQVPPGEREAWVNATLGLGPPPDDGPQLPRECVPYLPCAVDSMVSVVEHAQVRATDVFVDVGSGVGRAAALVNLLSGAQAVGIEVQPALVEAARALVARLPLPNVSFVEGDVATLDSALTVGSVFFLYCPFGGDRLTNLLTRLEAVARLREICIATVNLPLPKLPWLRLSSHPAADIEIYRSTLLD